MPNAADLKPVSEACERNKQPIAEALQTYFAKAGSVLEIASGTGQHAVYIGAAMPQLEWQCSDLAERHPGIEAWLDEAGLTNVRPPLTLDVLAADWPAGPFDYVFSANSAHIMAWPAVCAMFRGAGRVLRPGGVFALYGPFNRGGNYTSESNRKFDAALRAEDPAMGLRDLEQLLQLANKSDLRLLTDRMMPANNQLLIFLRQ